jgi:ATP-dependent Lon protease
MALFVALYSLIKGRPVLPRLVILGQVTVKGTVLPATSVTELLRTCMDNGARRVLLPTENKRQFLEVPGDVVEKVDPVFYSDALAGVGKATATT